MLEEFLKMEDSLSNSMKTKKKKDSNKVFQLDKRQLSELSFTVTQAEVANRQAAFWEHSIEAFQNALCKTLSIDTENFVVDWSGALEFGKIEVIKKPQIKIESVKENEQVAEDTKSDK